MVGKVLTRSSFGVTINYNERKGELLISNMIGTSSTYSRQMEIVAIQNDRIKKPVKHFVLAFAPEDEKKITPELCKEFISDYLKQMGYENNQYCSYLHKDTDNLHIHIVCNRVSYDGRVVKDSNEKYKSRKILNSFEKKYGLQVTAESGKSNHKDYKFTDNHHNKKNIVEDDRITYLREQVRWALKQHPISLESFKNLLSEKNIKTEITYNKGIKFCTDKGFKISGSRLNKLYSLQNINAQIRKNGIFQFKKALHEALKTYPENISNLFAELKKQGFQVELNKAGNGWTMAKDGVTLKGSELNRMSFKKLKETVDINYKSKTIRGIIFEEINRNKTFKDFVNSLNNRGIEVKTESGESKLIYESGDIKIGTGKICNLEWVENNFGQPVPIKQPDFVQPKETPKISLPNLGALNTQSGDDDEEERKRKKKKDSYEQTI